MKRLLVLGADGYLGFPVSLNFASKGWSVYAVDNLSKRYIESKQDVSPLIPLPLYKDRFSEWNDLYAKNETQKIKSFVLDIAVNNRQLYNLLEEIKPDAIIHFAEQPSAPYSMKGRYEAVNTQVNNITGTLNLIFAIKRFNPSCHIVKLGTMGEYGTPNIDIEEGWLNISHNNRNDRVLFPKKPGSFYHLSKVHDSNNLEYSCRTWGLKVTDLNQGIVYGSHTELSKNKNLHTSFHYDSIFGTAINRFIAQGLINHPLTIYGSGNQTRAYLHIDDVIQCIELAIENPAEEGEFKVRNQFTEFKSINELALLVSQTMNSEDIKTEIKKIDNPRVEESDHYYNPKNKSFLDLGLNVKKISKEVILDIVRYIRPYIKNVRKKNLLPNIKWNNK